MKKKQYDDDDGRQIADMSGVERRNLWLPRFGHKNDLTDDVTEETAELKKKEFNYTKSEKFAAVMGALAAALLIGAAFAVGIGLFIFLLTRFG